MKPTFLEKIGEVKTARVEAESILLARTILSDNTVSFEDHERLLQLVKRNKALLRISHIFSFPTEGIDAAKQDVKEAFEQYHRIGDTLSERGISYVSMK